MGIQGLAKRLEPYATVYSPQELEGYVAIIDGPSLAYHAHKLALLADVDQAGLSSYADINNEAIRWLSSLEDQGVKVSAILFDGALPESKRPERISRTEASNKRVQQLRSNYPTTACPIPTHLGGASYAFLAPSLRETLADLPFASRTQIVAGEADDSCAVRAKEHPRSIIFTSDTDLLLYDYHPETLVILFQDANLSAGTRAYSPDRIRQKLELSSLIPFAYVIQEKIHPNLEILLQLARSTKIQTPMYLNFSRRYTEAVVEPDYMVPTHNLWPALQTLDVRVAELVHQALSMSARSRVFLPLLVEDSNQASAWNVAQDVRTLAYSLLAPVSTIVREFRRKAQGISPQDVNLYSGTDSTVPAKQLEEQLGALMRWAEPKDLEPPLLWSLFALSFVLAELNTPPPLSLVVRVINGDFDNTWAFIQLTARVQAAMYSLRMLKQLIAIRLATNSQIDPVFYDCLTRVHAQMASFPSIAEMFIVPGQAERVLADDEQMKGLVEEIYQSAGAEIPNEEISNKKKKRQAREAERKRRKDGAQTTDRETRSKRVRFAS